MEVIVIRNKEDFNEKLNEEILKNSFNVYCRVSTISQIDNTSLQNQSEKGIEYCKKYHFNEFKYIIDWREEGKSGDDLNDGIGEVVRRELLTIIVNKWEEGLIRNFWVFDLSRLSRNEDSSMVLKQKLFKYGIKLYVDNSQYNFDSKQDKLMFSILSSFNEFENTMRFEKGLMGKRRNLDDNKWWGGNINFGFKNDGNGKLVEDEKNSKWVNKIFEWYNSGLSTIRIKERLMKLEVKTNRQNTNWNTSSIRIILSNTMYIGYKEYLVKGIKGKSKEYCESKGMLFRHTFKCQPIIDEEVFKQTQKLLSNNRRKTKSNKHDFLLKGKLICGGCGKVMRGKFNEKNNINIYKCISNEENYRNPDWKKCNEKRGVNRVGLEELVWIQILNVLKNSELVKETYRKINLPSHLDEESIKKRIKQNIIKIKNREKKIIRIYERLEENMIKNVTLKISDKMFDNVKFGVEEEIEKIQNEISHLKIQNNLWLNNNVWEDWFESFIVYFNEICKYTKFEDRKKFMDDHIEKIDIIWDNTNNTHNIKIHFLLNLIKDKGELVDKNIYKIEGGKNILKINGINLRKLNNKIGKEKESKTTFLNYSTVVDCFKRVDLNENQTLKNNYNSIIVRISLSTKSSKLTKTSHYSNYQQQLYDEIKMLKEEYDLGYRRISYLIYEKGYRGVRNNQVLRNNDIHSIYKKGKIRENRINRDFDTIIDNVIVFENRF
jgi:site-specific DNA recombinase